MHTHTKFKTTPTHFPSKKKSLSDTHTHTRHVSVCRAHAEPVHLKISHFHRHTLTQVYSNHSHARVRISRMQSPITRAHGISIWKFVNISINLAGRAHFRWTNGRVLVRVRVFYIMVMFRNAECDTHFVNVSAYHIFEYVWLVHATFRNRRLPTEMRALGILSVASSGTFVRP